jgi:hypothetical protein
MPEFAELEDVLQQGVLESEGMLPWSSNYTFLLTICHEEQEVMAVYKPRRGERPLWDFPQGTLCKREVAAYVVSKALDWNLVPPTVLRKGPQGIGSIQWFVPHNPDEHYFTFEGQFVPQVQKMVLFDVMINNADRKSGHVLLGENDHLWGIDHGICFHAEHKLRTVIWEHAGEEIPDTMLVDMERFAQEVEPPTPVYQQLATLLSLREIDCLLDRVSSLLLHKSFPQPGPGRHYPWPLI